MYSALRWGEMRRRNRVEHSQTTTSLGKKYDGQSQVIEGTDAKILTIWSTVHGMNIVKRLITSLEIFNGFAQRRGDVMGPRVLACRSGPNFVAFVQLLRTL
jgi:hypothetical protein